MDTGSSVTDSVTVSRRSVTFRSTWTATNVCWRVQVDTPSLAGHSDDRPCSGLVRMFGTYVCMLSSALGYQCGAVDEMCGETADGRNLVCLPDGVQRRPFFVRYRLQRVTASSVFRLASYCRDGGVCCPYGRNATEVFDPVRSRWTNCCSNRGCFSLLLPEECAATGALTTSNKDSHCGAMRDRYGPVRHRRQSW